MKDSALNQDSFSPLYKQLMQRLRHDIHTGVYPVSSRIPSEMELGETYQVSRVTVRRALAALTDEGLLRRHQGKGTFVSVPRLMKDMREVNSFHDACRMRGCTPSTRVIHAGLVMAEDEDMEKLHVGPGEQVVQTTRLRCADGLPVMLEINHFPPVYAYLLQEDLTASLYETLRRHGMDSAQATHEISLCHAMPSQAKHLDVEPGDALLQLFEVIYDQNGAPLHTSRQLIRGDRFTFRI